MDCIKDSIETSVKLKLFNNKEDSMKAHIYKSQLKKILLSKFKNVVNFNSNRLQDSAIKAYPISDRPRGAADINSVKYYQRLIKKNKVITPIWLLLKNNKYILLDGAHRIVASYIELQKYINCYVIEL
uniref:Uncharacterized protein n=1 Tax=viral metagenome TaxID=1070528 RepID=A0A6C0DCD6_9ZZZZ